MNFNTLDIHAAAALLAPLVAGGVIRRIQQDASAPDALILEVRVRGADHHLRLDPGDDAFGGSRISRCAERPPAPTKPSAFVMLLRKHLMGARVRSLDALPTERIVIISFDRFGDETHVPYALIVELMGRHSNIYLAARAPNGEDDGKQSGEAPDEGADFPTLILGVLNARRALPRGATPGSFWAPPAAATATPPTTPAFSWRVERDVAEHFKTLEANLTIARGAATHAQTWRTTLRSFRQTRKRLARRLSRVEGDLARAEGADALRARAELLRSAYGKVRRGQTSVEVVDYCAEGAPIITLEIDPLIPLQTQITDLYHEYKRMKRAATSIRARARETEDALLELELVLEDAEARVPQGGPPPSADDVTWIVEARAKLEEAKIIKPARSKSARARATKGPRRGLPYRHFVSSDGWDILVGRGNAQNDALTFQVANGRDLWMHARDWAGAHVVIRVPTRGADIPSATMRDAALLAIHYSKGKSDSHVEVGYTHRKHVTKPAGMSPGRVIVASQRTIAFAPDPAHVATLARADRG